MGYAGDWIQNQQNTITFVLIDAAGAEVSGLGSGFTLELRKVGGSFNASAGVKSEISDGWYQYISTAGEADTRGPVSIRTFGAGTIQQNLEYVVGGRNAGCIEFTYTLTEPPEGVGDPIPDAEVWISTDVAGANIVWNGRTDAFGVARDNDGNLPCLDAGDYFFFRQRVGYTFINPDMENVS